MAGLYSSIMTVLSLSLLTPYFYYIPKATLASVLVIAVIFMVRPGVFFFYIKFILFVSIKFYLHAVFEFLIWNCITDRF